MEVSRASNLKQNIWVNVDTFLQNKRKRTSIVVICRPCSCKWRILANIGDFEQGLKGYSRDPGFDQNTVRDSGKRKIS